MLGGKQSNFIVAIAAAGFGAFLAVWLLDFAVVRADWCAGVEAACFREWTGALSGWAAAVAAGLTILFLHRENRKRDILEWREIVNSAELLRVTLWPQIEHLGAAIRQIDDVRTVTWLGPCLDKIEAALLDRENQTFRHASVATAGQLRSCLLLLDYCKVLVANARARSTPIEQAGMLEMTLRELESFTAELVRVRESAFNPKAYRGV